MEERKIVIYDLISSNAEIFDHAFLMRFPTDEEISEAEKTLGMKIPEEYVWFLKTYGHGGFCFELLGYGLNGTAMFVEKTMHERTYGMPKELLVIESMDEYVSCIHTQTGRIVSWSKHDNDGVLDMADDFYSYFINRIQNAIDNY